MHYSDFRRRFASAMGPSGGQAQTSFGLPAQRTFQGAVAIATIIVGAMVSLAFPDAHSILALLAGLAFLAVARSWQALDRAAWQIDDSRYLSPPHQHDHDDPEAQRQRWYQHRALAILGEERVTADTLSYLHKASGRASQLSQRKLVYIAGLLAMVAGWCYLLFEPEFERFVATASPLTKAVLSVYLLGMIAIFSPVLLNQRFATADRIIENTLYDIISLGLYDPLRQQATPSPSPSLGPGASRSEPSLGASRSELS